ncbi:serine-threonine protein phosphatase, putative [Bodo saltans]|nr:serine-threonine protein phosphatase, putative [Bodo saltans]|eukprot:CUG88499.1 serine-threonine protein phosphatase, putative [Bodo saltans]
MNRVYGFEGEVKKKYDDGVFDLFSEVFNALPTGHIINGKVFVTHGGLTSKDDVLIEDLQKPNRFGEIPESGLICESLWADPQPMKGRSPSKRGVGLSFGPDVTEAFLARNNLKLVVRSHEVKDNGYVVEHDGKCITIFSAPNYCDSIGNKGAFIRFRGADMEPKFTTFEHVQHPGKKAMYYSSAFGGMM